MVCSTAENRSSLLGLPVTPLELRVCNAPMAGQLVRLQASKCTIGSGPTCTLRLRAPYVQPLHCLIVRGEQGTVIRQWSADTRLNGNGFTDSLLQAGDRLSIGPIELEVVSTGSRVPAPAEQSEPVPFLAQETFSQQAEQAELDELRATLQAELAVRAGELAARESDLSARLQELVEQESQLQRRLQELDERTIHWRTTQDTQQQSLETEQASLQEQQAALLAQQAELASLRATLEAERAEQEVALAQRQNTLEQQLAACAADQRALEQDKLTWTAERQRTEETWSQREAELADRQAELAAREAELQAASAQRADAGLQTTALHELQTQLEEDRKALAADRTTLEADRAALAAERSVWVTSCQETNQELLERQAALQTQAAELTRAQAELTDRQQTWTTEQASQQRALEERSNALTLHWEKLEERQARLMELEASLAELQITIEQQREQWGIEQAAQQRLLQEREFDLTAQAATLAQERLTLAEQREDLRQRSEQLSTEQAESKLFGWTESGAAQDEEVSDEPAFEPVAGLFDRALFTPQEQPEDSAHFESQTEEDHAAEELGEEETDLEDTCSISQEVLVDEDNTDDEDRYEEAAAEVAEPVEEYAADRQAEAEREAEEPTFVEPAEESPAEHSGLMERLRAMADWDETEAAEQPALGLHQQESTPAQPSLFEAAAYQRPEERPFTPISPPAYQMPKSIAPHQDDEEESIEDYMAGLLRRVRGEAEPVRPSFTPSATPAPARPESTVQQPANSSVEASNLEYQLSVATEPFKMPPRQLPPELTSNLAAMRELANFSAREAIDVSVRSRWLQAGLGKMAVAVIGILCASILLVWSNDPYGLTFLASGAAMLVAVFWGLQGAIIFRNVYRANQQMAEVGEKSADAETEEMRRMLFEETEPTQEAAADSMPEAAATPAFESKAQAE